MSDDFYEALGVERNASGAEIKSAYRKLAMKYHPDRNPDDQNAEKRFKHVKEAYEILSDDQKRTAYDQFGRSGVDPNMGGGGPGPGGFGDLGDIFGDIFGDVFGGRAHGQSRPQQGRDLVYAIHLTLEQAIAGVEEKIRIPIQVECSTCDGQGAKPGTSAETCGQCQGTGQVQMQQGFLSIQQTCSTCRGQGKIIKNPCVKCRGAGRIKEQTTLSVKIPPGVDTGDRIRVSGKGEAGLNGGPAGDLYVEIEVKPNAIFKRDGNNLLCDVPISFATAVLGGEIEVPTLSGRVSLKIPSETQTGALFRIRGKGVKSVRAGRTGDLLCRVIIESPVRLNTRQKNLLKEFDNSLCEDANRHNPKANSWLNGIKRFFNDIGSK